MHFMDTDHHEITPSKKIRSRPGHSLNEAFSNSSAVKSVTPSRRMRPGRRSATTTPKAKLRHDDSQIQFAAIESSPLLGGDNEQSQLLTDRQKEVRERQEKDAALFPDVGPSSSPADKPTDYRLPRLSLPLIGASNSLEDGEGNSPIYSPNPLMSNFIGSSPTPSTARSKSADPILDDGPPSSPPLIPSHTYFNRSFPDDPLQENIHAEENHDSVSKQGTGHEEVLPSFLHNAGATGGLTVETLLPEDPMQRLVQSGPNQDETNIMLDSDVYVDAPIAPVEGPERIPDLQQGPSDLLSSPRHTVASSNESQLQHIESPRLNEPGATDKHAETYGSQRSSQQDLENEEVTAQLMNDMAMASQASVVLSADQNTEETSLHKRKSSAMDDDEDLPNKKRAAPRQRGPQHCSTDTSLDGILVESSSAANNANRVFPPLKRKSSPSMHQTNPTAHSISHASNNDAWAEIPIHSDYSVTNMITEEQQTEENQENAECEPTRENTQVLSGSDKKRSKESPATITSCANQPADTHSQSRASNTHASEAVEASSRQALSDEPAQPIERSLGNQREHATSALRQSPRNDSSCLHSILARMHDVLEDVKQVSLRPDEEMDVMDALVETMREVQHAKRRAKHVRE